MEKYIIINEFSNYAISNYGNIKNVKKNKLLKPVINPNGYYSYVFCQNGIKKGFRIHRLVALHFIDNPNNKPYVNHKDGNKLNNHVDNLEWCSAKENDNHARTIGLKKQEKPILATNMITDEQMSFISVSEAGAILGINKGTISKVLKGKRKQVHNFTHAGG